MSTSSRENEEYGWYGCSEWGKHCSTYMRKLVCMGVRVGMAAINMTRAG